MRGPSHNIVAATYKCPPGAISIYYVDFYFVGSPFIDMRRLAAWRSGSTWSEGSSPSGAETAPQPCIRSIREDRCHDAVIRIGGKAPGRRVHSAQRLGSYGFYIGSPPPRIHRQTP